MAHRARIAAAGLVAFAAAALGSVAALAYDKIDPLAPVPAGRAYVYYVHEVDTDHQPIEGHTVTISVQRAPGSDATVAPSDSKGHPTGPAGQTASQQSGSDGFAYFLLTTSKTPGDNEFTWTDGTYTGQVVVVGLGATALASASPSGAAAHGRAGSTGGKRPSAVTVGAGSTKPHQPPGGIPPLAAGIVAAVLVWLLAPPALARRARAGRPLFGALGATGITVR